MKQIIFIAALLIFALPVQAKKGELYYCSTKDVMQVGAKGLLVRNASTELKLKMAPHFTFYETSGLLRMGSGGALNWTMEVIQQGSAENSAIGLHKYRGSAASGAEVFRIRTWSEGMPFVYLTSSEIFTGNCKVI